LKRTKTDERDRLERRVRASRSIKHPGRNLQPAIGVRAIQCAPENRAAGFVDYRMDENVTTEPSVKTVQNLSPNGPVGVLKPCCTIIAGFTRRSAINRQ
jgi:hypothetical protein